MKEINTPSLTDLELNFDFNYIKNEGGKAIGELLSSLKSVTSLHIGVASKNFGYLGYKSIIKGLASMTQLRKLTLRCGVNRVGFNGAEITRDALLKFPDLECLNLNFVENYVGDDGIAILA